MTNNSTDSTSLELYQTLATFKYGKDYSELDTERQQHILKWAEPLHEWAATWETAALINELKTLIEPIQCYRATCNQKHTLLKRSYVLKRIAELQGLLEPKEQK